MGLSNYLANSRINQPGVCTSSTRPASPYEGQVIYETDTNRVLVYDSAAWVMIADTDQPPGMQLVKTQTVGTAVTSVAVTSVFSADYVNYKILYNGGTGTTNGGILLQLGPSSVGAYNSGYYRGILGIKLTDGTTATGYDNNASSWTNVGNTTNGTVSLSIELYGPHASERTGMNFDSRSFVTNDYVGLGSGFHNSTNSFTDFTISIQNGSITGGTIRVYGYRN
jgi:hypothetical protein